MQKLKGVDIATKGCGSSYKGCEFRENLNKY